MPVVDKSTQHILLRFVVYRADIGGQKRYVDLALYWLTKFQSRCWALMGRGVTNTAIYLLLS